MGRVLSLCRVTVPAARTAEYVALIGELSAHLATRGQHLWIFQSRGDGEAWIEFTEGRDAETHRSAGPLDAEEAALEAALAQLVSYHEADAPLWDEVRPAAP